jgi:very-short-patch-repair endonuclease
MPANKIQIQKALHKPYDRVLFAREVLSPVFGSGFTLNSALVPAGVLPNKSESAVIDKVWIYGNIQLDDSTEITCYEVLLQPKVRIEQSKVAIQQYVRKLLTAGQAALINFVAPANKNVWRLTLVAKDSVLTDKGVKEKKTNAKRYTFLLGPSETCKTAAERFEALSTEKEITIQTLINAFSVEKLSKAFFDEYTLHYQNFCNYLQESNYRKSVFNISFPANATKQEKDKASKPIRDFVKKLLGRIVFLYFVQKKGWLGASDTNYSDGLRDFIKQLFHQSGGDDAFYSNWLTVLFFNTLNKERTNDDFQMPDGKTVKVPFLNGGLFDKEEFDEHLLTFPAKLFHNPDFEDTILTEKNKGNARGFLDFLDAFNFTIYEDSPDDHTVAVDPEMLGHIFENLLEDNKDKGAFYTPKEIVHYMCQESLTEYLKNSPPLEGCPKDGVVRNSQNYFNLPYNPNLKEKARKLRKAGNLPEVLFWNRVKNKQFKGFDFDRQKIVGNYIVDFFCTNCNVVIEIDGSSHDDKADYDVERDAFLQSLGLTVIHIPVKDVMSNLDGVMQMLFDHPALKGTPPKEGNEPPLTPPVEGNEPPLTPPKEGKWGEKVKRLLKQKEVYELSKEELFHIDALLDRVKICDPAIGSGAFPMGLLQEIFSIKELIAYETGKEWNPAETKLNIIQNSIYGVDIEKGAVDIARLRFWLSLVVDEEKPKPLPNLDYKIVVGDSLISKFDGEIVEIDWERKQSVGKADEYVKNVQRLLKEVAEKQKQYFSPNNQNKKKLQAEIRNLKIELLINQLSFNKELYLSKNATQVSFMSTAADIKHNTERELQIAGFNKLINKLKNLLENPEAPFNHFDWKLDFPEVLNPYLVPDEKQRGFDIVIANPPYISIRTNSFNKKLKEIFKKKYELAVGQYDVYVLFLELTNIILNNRGCFSFIIPQRMLSNESFESARIYIISKMPIFNYVNAEMPFENANVEVNIMLGTKARKINKTVSYKYNPSLKEFSFLSEISYSFIKIMPFNIFPFVFDTKRLKILENIQIQNNHVLSEFLEITRGFECGYSDSSIKTIKTKYPLIKAESIQRYNILSEDILYCEPDFLNVSKFKTKELFMNTPKLVTKFTSNEIVFALDNVGYFNTNSVYNCHLKETSLVSYLLLLPILNSKLITFWFNSAFLNIDNLFPHIQKNQLENIPIKIPSNSFIFENVCNYILFLKNFKQILLNSNFIISYFEQIIDGMVYELYFPELLKKYNREVIKHLGDLPEFTDDMSDEQKMTICKKVFERLHDAAHPVRINLEKMKEEIPEILIIEGLEN